VSIIGAPFDVVTIHATTEDEAADLVEATVEEWMAMAGGAAANDNMAPEEKSAAARIRA